MRPPRYRRAAERPVFTQRPAIRKRATLRGWRAGLQSQAQRLAREISLAHSEPTVQASSTVNSLQSYLLGHSKLQVFALDGAGGDAKARTLSRAFATPPCQLCSGSCNANPASPLRALSVAPALLQGSGVPCAPTHARDVRRRGCRTR